MLTRTNDPKPDAQAEREREAAKRKERTRELELLAKAGPDENPPRRHYRPNPHD